MKNFTWIDFYISETLFNLIGIIAFRKVVFKVAKELELVSLKILNLKLIHNYETNQNRTNYF